MKLQVKVIQRRGNFSGDLQDFNQDWNIYKLGFGRLEEEFWLGNENIHTLTKQEECVLRIELEDFDGNQRWAEYVIFQVFGEEQQYRISVDGYRGNAGDALADRWYGINLLPFSTFDKDNDRSPLHCGQLMQNGWWWRSCGRSLNGKYSSNPRNKHASKGVVWFRWRGWYYSLRKVEMKIRPQWFSTASSLISETERLKRRFRFPKAMP
ncbi:techylectin-5B-like [Limulus polyphemus]|uniref:Techylectin-5B-like n=1 Tax=Limulus polyphemus TaxID=6850 RepID=A0ABM1T479_LIMPO|nr:techylectin-5B-like [Limulus polyphemus]